MPRPDTTDREGQLASSENYYNSGPSLMAGVKPPSADELHHFHGDGHQVHHITEGSVTPVSPTSKRSL